MTNCENRSELHAAEIMEVFEECYGKRKEVATAISENSTVQESDLGRKIPETRIGWNHIQRGVRLQQRYVLLTIHKKLGTG